MSVDVRRLGADWIVGSSHKMCGPTGIGFLWGRAEVLEAMLNCQDTRAEGTGVWVPFESVDDDTSPCSLRAFSDEAGGDLSRPGLRGASRGSVVGPLAIKDTILPLMARVTSSSAFVGPVVEAETRPYVALMFDLETDGWERELRDILVEFGGRRRVNSPIKKFALTERTRMALVESMRSW